MSLGESGKTIRAERPTLSAGSSGLNRWWARLPLAGRIAVAAVPVVVLVIIIGAVVSGNSRDERSYQYGRDSAIPAHVLLDTAYKQGFGDSDDLRRSFCRDMVNRNQPDGIVFDDAMAGCLDNL
jgi:hypothetical protein